MADEQIIQQDIPQQQTGGSDPDPLQSLYDGLHKSQLYTKSFDEFKQKYSDPKSIDDLYGKLNGLQLYTKGKQDFYDKYFPPSQQSKPFVQPKVEFSQPGYNGKLNGNPDWVKDGAIIQPPNLAIPDKGKYHGDTGFDKEVDNNATKLNTKTNEAAQVIKNHLASADNNYSDVVRQSRSDQITPETIQKEYQSKGQVIPVGAMDDILKLEKKKAYNLPVTQNDIEDAKTSINTNSNLTRQFLTNSAKQDANINQSLYRLDAAHSLKDDPNAKYRLPQVLKNDKDLESGDIDYDPATGQLTKKEGFFGSIASNWDAKENAFKKYSEYKGITNDDALISQLKSDIQDEQDKPQSKASGILGHLGAFVGGTPVLPMLAGAAVSAIPYAEEAAPAAMAAVGAPEFYRMAYSSGLKRAFAEYLQQDPTDEHEALRKAKAQAENEGNYAAATAAVMNLVGGKLGVETKFPTSATFKQSIVKGLKEFSEFAKTKLKEGAAVGTMGAAGQVLSNLSAQDAGLNRDTLEGTGQQLAMGMALPLAMGLLTNGAGALKKGTSESLLHNISKAGNENIEPALNELQATGHITPEQSAALKMSIDDHKAVDNIIPADIDETSRLKIGAKIRERNILKANIETTDEAFHPDLKDRIKKLNEEIITLSKNKTKQNESETSQKAEASQETGILNEQEGVGQKPAPSTPEIDKKVLEDAVSNKEIKGAQNDVAEYVLSKDDPETTTQFYKDVADQALNKVAPDAVHGQTDSYKQAVNDYGQNIVDHATKLFPLKTETNAETIRGHEGQVHVAGNELQRSAEQSSGDIQQQAEGEPITPGTGQQAGNAEKGAPESKEVGGPPGFEDLPFTGRTGEGIGISHGSAEARATDVPVLPPERGEGVTVEDAIKHGQDLMAQGGDAEKAAADFKADKKISYDALSLVRAKHADLAKATNNAIDQHGEGSKEAQSAIKAESDWYKNTVKPMQTEWHKIGQAQQGESDIDTGSYIGMKRAFMQETGKEPSSQQAKEAKGLSGKVQGLTKQVEDLKQQLSDALDKATTATGKASKSAKQKADEFADLIRKGKTNRPGSFQAATPASLVWDSALEVMAKTVEAGGSVIQAIADGIEHIKGTDWYKGLSEDKQKEAEDSYNNYFKDSDITTKFAAKRDNKFDPQDAKDIWDYAKSNYLNKGKDFDTMIHGTAMDLGLTPVQVRNALTQPKGTKVITDEMYKKQYYQQQAIQRAKAWVKSSNTPAFIKALKFIPHLFFRLKTFGHGTVGGITHAGMNIFRPSDWKSYWPNFFKQFKFAFGKTSDYQKAMSDLTNDRDFIMWKRAGLAVDPTERYDDYQTFDKMLGRLGAAGDRGFNALKIMRLQMAKAEFERLSDVEKADPETLKTIASIVNHATGTSKIPVPEVVGVAVFAPRLEASRWARLIVQPAEAVKTVLNWKNASIADKAAAKIVAKRSGEIVAGYMAALAANQGILWATGSKQSINFIDPTSSDWLKFKVADRTLDLSGGMVSALGFLSSMIHIASESQSDLKGKKRGDELVSKGGRYLRGKLSPFGSTVADVTTQHDFGGNTMPFSSDKPTTQFAHQLTWKEYLLGQQTPIPVSESIKDATDQMKERGMSEVDINTVMQAILVGATAGGIGARVGTDYTLEPKPGNIKTSPHIHKRPIVKHK